MSKYHAFVLSAGVGARMGGPVPKQYIKLLGKPVIYFTIQALAKCNWIDNIFVLLACDDEYFSGHDWGEFSNRVTPLYCGGATRAETVLGGLYATQDTINEEDWIMVHDAVRPCLDLDSLNRLHDQVSDQDVGGVLAVPVVDTIKKSNVSGYVEHTIPREYVWRAQTPQMFRFKLLLETHQQVDPRTATDESSVVEQMGHKPKLVIGNHRNIKITYPVDLQEAETYLQINNTYPQNEF